MKAELCQRIGEVTKREVIEVTLSLEGLTVTGTDGLAEDRTSAWVRDDCSFNLAEKQEVSEILQRVIIEAVRQGGKLVI